MRTRAAYENYFRDALEIDFLKQNNPGERDTLDGILDLMPASISLSGLEVSLVNAMSRESILKQYLEPLKKNYDFIILDCMPSLGIPYQNHSKNTRTITITDIKVILISFIHSVIGTVPLALNLCPNPRRISHENPFIKAKTIEKKGWLRYSKCS